MTTWRHLHTGATERLGDELDARRIVQRASGRTSAEWLLALDEQAPARCVPFIDDMVERRLTGEPLQYVVGAWGFRHLDLLVDRRVLIPRPETEQVVEEAVRELTRLRLVAGRTGPVVADLGTGSGAIALSIAAEVQAAEVWAVDASEEACAVARANLAGLGGMAATRVRIVEGSWFAALPGALRGAIDLVVSNPPYIADDERADLPDEVVQWEPSEALFAGPTGLEAIHAVVNGATRWLRRPGVVVVEVAPHQGVRALELARRAGFDEVDIRPDLAGRDRVLVAGRS